MVRICEVRTKRKKCAWRIAGGVRGSCGEVACNHSERCQSTSTQIGARSAEFVRAASRCTISLQERNGDAGTSGSLRLLAHNSDSFHGRRLHGASAPALGRWNRKRNRRQLLEDGRRSRCTDVCIAGYHQASVSLNHDLASVQSLRRGTRNGKSKPRRLREVVER